MDDILGVTISTVGLVLLIYGKKRIDGLSITTGLILMIYPYFIVSIGWSISIGVAILAIYTLLKHLM